MAERNLPGIVSEVMDGGLTATPPPADLNDSILIIGTSEDGPMYEPLAVSSADEAESLFGAFGKGTLVRGVREAFDATLTGTPDIRAMRVGNGHKSIIEIDEVAGSLHRAATTGHKALRLEAKYPGKIYDSVSVFLDEDGKVSIFNPKTGYYSSFTYDRYNPYNSTVDAHNSRELADAINNDPNMSTILVASVSGIQASYELNASGNAYGISVSNGTATVTLNDLLSGYAVADPKTVMPTGYLFDPVVSTSAGNLIDELQEVFAITHSKEEKLSARGKQEINVALQPFTGKTDARFDTILALEDYGSDGTYIQDPSGTTNVSEYIEVFDNVRTATYPTVSGQVSANPVKFDVFTCPDDSEESSITVSGVASGYILGTDSQGGAATYSGKYWAGNADPATATSWTDATTQGMELASGYLTIEVSDVDDNDPANWTKLLVDSSSGVYLKDWDIDGGGANNGRITLAFGTTPSGYSVDNTKSPWDAGLVEYDGSAWYVKPNKFVRLSGYSVKGFLTEASTLPALDAATADWTTYFVRGNNVRFSDALPNDLIVNYMVKLDFEPGSDVVLSDSSVGELKFPNKNLQPGPAGKAMSNTAGTVLGLKYKYLPEWPNVNTTAISLDGGSNGTKMSKKQMYDEFDYAYTLLRDYECRIFVPMGAYLDAVRKRYNKITGLEEEVNAQFQEQLHKFLDDVSVNVGQAIGVIGVTPPSDVTLAGVSQWVDKLTITDLSDPNRGANIMPLLNSKYISVCAFEPRFDNLGGTAYAANGSAAYAGMISSLPSHRAPTHKSIPNALRTRYTLSESQLVRMAESRYVTMRARRGRNPVVTEAITAAAPGSDFVKLSTVRITFDAVELVRDVCEPFLGQPNSVEHRNAMESQISQALQAMKTRGALQAFDFAVKSSPAMQVRGDIIIDLTLVPVFEIRKIRVPVRLRTQLAQ